jgi:hypothetical protein
MWNKRIILLAGIFILVAVLFSQEKKPIQPSSPTGYQLVPTTITIVQASGSYEERRVFLVDSSSGNVWEFLPERFDKEHVFQPSGFQPVTIVRR